MSNEITSEQIRNRFEVWAKSANYELHRGQVTGDYMQTPTSYACEAWQAAEREQSPAVVTDEMVIYAYGVYVETHDKVWAEETNKDPLICMRAAIVAVEPLLRPPAVDHARVNVETVREVEADLREWGEAGDVQLLVRANWLAAAIGES